MSVWHKHHLNIYIGCSASFCGPRWFDFLPLFLRVALHKLYLSPSSPMQCVAIFQRLVTSTRSSFDMYTFVKTGHFRKAEEAILWGSAESFVPIGAQLSLPSSSITTNVWPPLSVVQPSTQSPCTIISFITSIEMWMWSQNYSWKWWNSDEHWTTREVMPMPWALG